MDKLKLPVQRFAAQFASETANSDSRTMEMTWQTGAQMDRYGWDGRFMLQLSMDPTHVRMDRLQSGAAPLLKNHYSDVEDVIGVIENASVKGGIGKATVRFSQRADVQPLFDDIKDGIIRNASVGANIYKLKDVTPQQKDENAPKPTKQYLAIDWQPVEISAVAIGADAGARFSAENITTFECEIEPIEVLIDATRATAQMENKPMDETTIQAGQEKTKPVEVVVHAVAAAAVDVEAVKAEATKLERARVAGINQKCKVAGMTEAFAQALVNEGVSLAESSDKIFAELEKASGKKIDGPNQAASVTRDGMKTKCEGVASALLHRYDPKNNPLREDAREYRGMSLLRIAEDFVSARGINVRGKGRDEIAALALERQNFAGGYEGTTDFPAILADVANKTLRQAYLQTPRTFVPIFRQVTAVDFKNMNRTQLGEAPQLKQIGPSGEFTHGSLGDAKETYKLATFGRIVALNRQTIVNDDLDAFSRIPAGYGMQAANLESDTVWGIITANAAMSDTVALFHATHKNLVSSGAGAPDVTQLSKSRKLLRLMTGLDGATLLNIMGKYLVVPSALETNVEQLVAQNIPLVPVTSATTVPQWFRSLIPVVEPRLDANSTTAHYLFADYGQIDTVEYAYLEGQEGVYIETRMGFDVDGIEIKARLDFGAKAIDWRGMVKNAGA